MIPLRGEDCQTKSDLRITLICSLLQNWNKFHFVRRTNKAPNSELFVCREEGIRTLDTVARILAFQASPFDHSGTSLYSIGKKGFHLLFPLTNRSKLHLSENKKI